MEQKAVMDRTDGWGMTDRLHGENAAGDPFAAAIRATHMAMIITDPRQNDNPIVFANDAFLRLTGYDRDDIVGRNCRFLQGPESDPATVAAISAGLTAREHISLDIVNYRKDGSTFWNALYISPVIDQSGVLQYFFASQLDIGDRKSAQHRVETDKVRFEHAVRVRTHELEAVLEAKEALLHEVDHRVKNNLQMISSLIVMQTRSIKDEGTRQAMRAMLERIEALSTVHRRLYQSKDVANFDVADFIRDLVKDIVAASGRPQITAQFDLQPVVIAAEMATPVALIVNELVTNALKHAFDMSENGSDVGTLTLKLERSDGRILVEVADNGAGMPASIGESSFGMRLVRSLARQLRADITWSGASPGTRVTITMPDRPPGAEDSHD